MPRYHQSPEALEAAAQWREHCLLSDGSILTDKRLWSLENLDHLDRYFVQNLDLGKGDFFSKLETQLAPAPASAKQLAGELLWLMYLFVASESMGAETKRRHIARVWEWSGEPFPSDAPALGSPLERGIGHPGTAYNTGRWRELVFLITIMRSWKALPSDEQRRRAADGWNFAEWIDANAASKGRQLRHMLLYLLHPEQFERAATGRDKRSIVKKFRERFGEAADEIDYRDRTRLDREILRIRERLEHEHDGQELDFYREPLRPLWSGGDDSTRPIPSNVDEARRWYAGTFGNARVWLVATGEGGRLWPEFQRDGLIAIDTGELGDLTDYETREQISEAIKEREARESEPVMDSLAAWDFANEMKPGDHVIAKKGWSELVGRGIVTSHYEYEADRAEYQHIRRVEWKATGSWSVPESRRVAGKALTDFSKYPDWLQWAWQTLFLGEDKEKRQDPAASHYSIEDAMHGLFVPADQLRQIVDALGRKQCIILEGAPGVGKTFVARRVAYTLLGYRDSTRVELVQFHQSYSYEDFVQGWRPAPEGGFRLQNGVFHRFCERARAKPELPFVFIIDEINRGNLSKIFGELMMLIEADKRGPDHAIPLTYSMRESDRFSVPENVHLLGLMNTADRSLAMVDYALRRRFGFFRLEPAFAREEFAEYLVSRGVAQSLVRRIVDRLTELNETIRGDRAELGPGFEIGHSYFVPPEGAEALDETWYGAVVRGEIEPLLREYWFDDPDRVDQAVGRLLV